jgi:uncharacterized membrane protein
VPIQRYLPRLFTTLLIFAAGLRIVVLGFAIAQFSKCLFGQQAKPTEILLPGGTVSGANAINSVGIVVGASNDVQQSYGAPFEYVAGVTRNLWPPFPDPSNLGKMILPKGSALAINNVGNIVGSGTFVDQATNQLYFRALLFRAGLQPLDPGTLGGQDSTVYHLNALDQGVGIADTPRTIPNPFGGRPIPIQHAALFSLSGSPPLDLGALGPGNSWGMGINDKGHIVGYSSQSNVNAPVRAVLFTVGIAPVEVMPTLSPELNSEAIGINNTDQIIGHVYSAGSGPSNPERAVLWDHGVQIDIGSLGGYISRPNAINDLAARGETGCFHAVTEII